jgi:hypothetical protein
MWPPVSTEEENRPVHARLLAPALLAAAVLGSTASAHDIPGTDADPCVVPGMRTDERPGAGGPPTEVSVGMRMVDLTDIDDVSQTLTGDFAVFQRWTDPRLAGLEGCEIPLEKIWTPGLRFINSGRLFTSLAEEADIGPDGAVLYVQRYYGTMATYHNLRRFPFDDQTFVVSLVSLRYAEDEIQLIVNEQVTGRRDLLNISDWTVSAVEAGARRQYIEATDRHASAYDLRISARRQRHFYVWKIIVPLCLIVFMSWTVFWINPAQFGPQIGLSATSMLTLIAFQFATTSMVPELGYFTTLDEFITGSTIVVFLALMQSLTTSYLVSQEKSALALRIDRLSRYLFPLSFVALVLVVFFR